MRVSKATRKDNNVFDKCKPKAQTQTCPKTNQLVKCNNLCSKCPYFTYNEREVTHGKDREDSILRY